MSNAIKCRYCEQSVNKTDKKCPHCGKKLKFNSLKQFIGTLIGSLLVFFIVVGFLFSTLSHVSSSHHTSIQVPEVFPGITQFKDLETQEFNEHNHNYLQNRSGDVHVRGYFRHNGVYVHSYTRSSPSHGRR